MISSRSRNEMRELRHRRLRRHLSGTAERPRLAVFASLKHISVQVIDDVKGHTLVSASTVQDKFDEVKGTGNQEAAKAVGKLIAERALAQGITEQSPCRSRTRSRSEVLREAQYSGERDTAEYKILQQQGP